MGRGIAVRNDLRGRTATAMMAAVSQRTTGMCARCGHSTTFVLEDPVGGWYMCVECGHFA
jgi:hypothetical protein